MWALVIIELEIGRAACCQAGDVRLVHEVDVLVPDRPPQALHEGLVEGSPSAVHADPGADSFQDARELRL